MTWKKRYSRLAVGRNDNYNLKKKVQSSGGFIITSGKRFSCLAVSGNIWGGSTSCWLLCLCVLCFEFCAASKTNLVFSSVTILSHILKNENYELCFLAGFFVNQITTGKNYNLKKKVMSSGRRLEWISDNRLSCQNTNTNYHQKKLRPEKKVQLSGRQLEYVSKYKHQLWPEKNMTGKKGTVVLLTPFATHITFYFYYVCT